MLSPTRGEEERLAVRRQLMMHAEKIAAELAETLDALQGEGTSGARLGASLRRIERQTSVGALLQPVAEALARVLAETDTARAKIEEALAATAVEPQELERAEERLFALRAVSRKHRIGVDDLPDLVARLESELAAIDVSEARAAELAASAQVARKAYENAATALSEARKKAAKRLNVEVTRELPPLRLDKASFATHIETVPLGQGGPSGIDRIAFFVATNPGAEPGPLIESGVGRRACPLHSGAEGGACRARAPAPTLVFDEADQGVGGATAAAVGERLARLPSRRRCLPSRMRRRSRRRQAAIS